MNILTFPVRVSAIIEHHRTIRGGKDTLGRVFTEEINLGWFLHLELLDGEPFGVALGLGTSSDRPNGITVGDELTLSLKKKA